MPKYTNTIETFWSRVVKTENDCWEWTLRSSNTYGTFSYKGTDWLTHRFAYTISKGPIPPGRDLVVCHTCDNRRCCNPDHLYLGTETQNSIDKVVRGNSRQYKLTESDAVAIREDTRPLSQIAKAYGVTYQSIWNVKHKRTFFWI